MPGDHANLLDHVLAIHRQLAALTEQVAGLTEQQKTLYNLVSQLAFQPAPAEHSRKAVQDTLSTQVQETLADCARDIVRVLREAGHPLTTLEILEQLVNRKLRWRESTVSHALADLTDHGVVANLGENGAHRYGLVMRP
jgi:hypothetical protein